MLLLSDGFDGYGAGALDSVDSLNAGNPGFLSAGTDLSISSGTGRFGGQSLHRAAGDGGSVEFDWGTGHRAAAGWFKGVGGSTVTPILTGAGVKVLGYDASRSFVVKDGAGTTRITAGGPADDTYGWFEVSFQNNYIELRLNGVTLGSYTGAYTNPPASMLLGYDTPSATDADIDIDDFIVWDDQGADFNTFGLQPLRIQLLEATEPGSFTAWAPNGATNWQSMVGGGWEDDPADGVVSVSAGQKDTYGMSNLTLNPSSILALTVRTNAVNDGATSGTLALVVRSGTGAETSSTPAAVDGSTPTPMEGVFYKDPAGLPWTSTTVNGLEAGVLSGV